MRIADGQMTVGDVGVQIQITANETLTGIDVKMVLVKPSGATLTKDTVIAGTVATYTTIAGDIDEDGMWRAYLYENDTGFYYRGHASWSVNPKPADMAKAR